MPHIHRRRCLLLSLCLMWMSSGCAVFSPVFIGQSDQPSIDELFLFQPARFPKGDWQPKDLNFQDVDFESSDGTKLHGWYCPADEPVATVLYLHGNALNLSHRASLLKELQENHRLSMFILDYRGYGKSEGRPTVQGAIADCEAARTKLAKIAGIEESEIVLMGRSLGGALAIQLAARNPPRALIVESSFASLKGIAQLHFPKLAWLVPEDKLDSVTALKECTSPTLISHGDADTLIPYQAGQRLYDAAPKRKRFVRIRNANHNDPQSANYYRVLDEFIRSLD